MKVISSDIATPKGRPAPHEIEDLQERRYQPKRYILQHCTGCRAMSTLRRKTQTKQPRTSRRLGLYHSLQVISHMYHAKVKASLRSKICFGGEIDYHTLGKHPLPMRIAQRPNEVQ